MKSAEKSLPYYAHQLQTVCADLLAGDFSQFDDIAHFAKDLWRRKEKEMYEKYSQKKREGKNNS